MSNMARQRAGDRSDRKNATWVRVPLTGIDEIWAFPPGKRHCDRRPARQAVGRRVAFQWWATVPPAAPRVLGIRVACGRRNRQPARCQPLSCRLPRRKLRFAAMRRRLGVTSREASSPMLRHLEVIQSFVAPVVMISANGLLCLAFYNRLNGTGQHAAGR